MPRDFSDIFERLEQSASSLRETIDAFNAANATCQPREAEVMPSTYDNNYTWNTNMTISTGSQWRDMGTMAPQSMTFTTSDLYSTIMGSSSTYVPPTPEVVEEGWAGQCGLVRCACLGTVYRDSLRNQPVVGLQQFPDFNRYIVQFHNETGRFEAWTYYAKSERMVRAYHDFYWPNNRPVYVNRLGRGRNETPNRAQVDEMVELRQHGQFTVDPNRWY